MKRANISVYNMYYPQMIFIETMSDLKEFFDENLRGRQKDSMTKLINRVKERAKGNSVGHTTDHLVDIAETASMIDGKGVFIHHAEIFGEIYSGMIKEVSKGNCLAINPQNGIGHFPFKKDMAVVDIISEKECYTEQNIRVFRWNDGKHWYAKIDQLDVVVDGEQKWNAKWQAEEKAKEFLKTL